MLTSDRDEWGDLRQEKLKRNDSCADDASDDNLVIGKSQNENQTAVVAPISQPASKPERGKKQKADKTEVVDAEE